MQPRRQQQLQTSIHRALKAYHFYHLFVLKGKKHVIQQKKPFATEQLCSNSLEETLNCVRTQVSVKQNVYIHKNIYLSNTMCGYIWKTACPQITFPFFLIFCLRCCNFLANITVRLFLGLNVWNNIIQNDSRQKPNYKLVYYIAPRKAFHYMELEPVET